MEDGDQGENRPHGEFGLMDGFGNVDRAQHVDGGLMNVGSDARYVAG